MGFPGETDEDFERTVELVEETRFAQLFAFKYSPRPGTAAPRLGPPIEREVADRRLQRLFAVQEPIQRGLNEALQGDEMDVLVTGWGRKPGTQSGRTPCHRVVHFPIGDADPAPVGRLSRVRIREALPHSLLAELA